MDIQSKNGILKSELLENNTHIYVQEFPVGIAKTVNFAHERHRHDFFSVDFVLEGECQQYINGKAYMCTPGTICLLSPLDDHYYVNKNPDTKIVFLTFSDDVMLPLVSETLNTTLEPYITTFSPEDTEILREEFALLAKEAKSKSPLRTALIQAMVNKILIGIIRAASDAPSVPSRKSDNMHNAISYVRTHFKESITMEETAALCHVTPSHFCKHFKKYTGLTFKEYLISLRLDYALRLILVTELPITQICIESGFASPSYFTKAFFKRFGKKPSQLRV